MTSWYFPPPHSERVSSLTIDRFFPLPHSPIFHFSTYATPLLRKQSSFPDGRLLHLLSSQSRRPDALGVHFWKCPPKTPVQPHRVRTSSSSSTDSWVRENRERLIWNTDDGTVVVGGTRGTPATISSDPYTAVFPLSHTPPYLSHQLPPTRLHPTTADRTTVLMQPLGRRYSIESTFLHTLIGEMRCSRLTDLVCPYRTHPRRALFRKNERKKSESKVEESCAGA